MNSGAPSPDLSLILPFRNQADHLASLVRRYLDEFRPHPWSFELVLVPNACTDESVRMCRELEAAHPEVRSVENPHGGWGRSVRAGLSTARGRYLCYTNSARTEPAQIPAVFSLARDRAPVLVKTVRRSRGNLLREFGSLLYNLECRALFQLRCRDVNGTPKVFPRELLDHVHLASDGDLLDVELLAKSRRLGWRVLEIPVEGWKRHGGKSSTNLGSARRMLLGALEFWWKGLPDP
ncbi:MAG TPA: glycosyltransferase [Planctomycetota bacterium]|nr:glycosyltransferase [Planctomycetota bacterium]